MKKKSGLLVRLLCYICGLVIMTLGVAVSVKADLGVSTISSIPYTMTCIAGIDLGIATIIFSIIMILIQIAVLRKNYKKHQLLQLPVSILFGLVMTCCTRLTVYMPDPGNMAVQLLMCLGSTVLVAIGLFMYVPAGFIPLAPEGAMVAIAQVTKSKFASVKLISDIIMVGISLVTCLLVIHELGSVGIGTILTALLVGNEVKWLNKWFGSARDRMMYPQTASAEEPSGVPLLNIMKRDVYTLSEKASLLDALNLFHEKKISGAPVVNGRQEIVGFISDGDIMRHLASEHSIFINDSAFEKIEFNKALMALIKEEVSSIAQKRIISVNAMDSLDEVCYKLGEHRIKKAPVMQDGKMIGIINVSNIIKYAVGLINLSEA